ARDLGRALGAREVGGHAHTDDRRQVLRPRPIAALLAAADDDGAELDLCARPERAGTGRAVEVVGGEREEVDGEVVDGERHAPGRADGVDVEWLAARARDASDLAQRLQRADLPVGRYLRHEG